MHDVTAASVNVISTVLFLGNHAGGAALSAPLHLSTCSLRQGDSSRQVLEGPEKYLHHRYPHGMRVYLLQQCSRMILSTFSEWCEYLICIFYI